MAAIEPTIFHLALGHRKLKYLKKDKQKILMHMFDDFYPDDLPPLKGEDYDNIYRLLRARCPSCFRTGVREETFQVKVRLVIYELFENGIMESP